MKNIGLIDDKDEARRAFKLKLDLVLEISYPGWQIIDTKPFADKESYRSWILENEISVLITDERLDEGPLVGGGFADYFGSDLVVFLRNYFKDLPIFCLTNVEITDQLKASLSYFNLILGKSKFDSDLDNYLNLFVKSGISFYTEFNNELSRLGELSEKYALGDATEPEKSELHTIQTRLTLPHLSEELKSREEYLILLERKIEEIKDMNEVLLKYLNNN
ncbi:hypothetical protein [Pedobacter sp. MR2016-24]|uniref:hypothetical protein n=1 Tax=Pedobacter sp. MR2016-24 TaxID=2994466 RepID=UPI002247C632|nr:hypothetical protein [Pedobacter sp. MR2016-24]MCX2485070.1 hypothetical protein [Pedobacter sp. MR2016-24]